MSEVQIYYNSFGDMNDSELFPSRGTCVLDGENCGEDFLK